MLVAIHVVSKHEKPGYKLTWVFTILTLPIFGGAFYLMMRLQPSVHRFPQAGGKLAGGTHPPPATPRGGIGSC